MIEVQQTPQEVALPKSKEDEPFTLERLVERIHQILGPDGGLDSEHIGTGEILRLMESYSSNAADWSKYAFFDHSRAYTRNLVDDGNGKFNLMILAWSKGQQSPIHDHSGSHCIMKVLDGELQETQYAWPSDQATAAAEAPADCTDITAAPNADSPRPSQSKGGQPLKVTKDGILKPNQVTYIHDKIGLHRISNPNAERGAVSLHLYTPPYEACKTFEADTGRARSSGKCSFYTIQGQRCVQQ